VLYRGINIDLNAVMKQKYDAYETAFAVGTKLTFPAPTACSTSDVVAGHFMNGIQLVIHKAGGVALVPGLLSAYDESEVMLPFPSTFKVIARSKVQDTVVVMIEAVPSAFSYCSAPEQPFLTRSSSSSATTFTTTTTTSSSSASAGGGGPPSLSDLTVPDVVLIVACRGTAFEGYCPAIVSNGFGGETIDMLDGNDLEKLMESMAISTNHRLVLKATFSAWKKNPEKAFEALATAKVKGRTPCAICFVTRCMRAG